MRNSIRGPSSGRLNTRFANAATLRLYAPADGDLNETALPGMTILYSGARDM
jgi:hypothetical protein